MSKPPKISSSHKTFDNKTISERGSIQHDSGGKQKASEMINHMQFAKEKVEKLAEKLKLAKKQILYLRSELTEKSKLLDEFSNVNQSLLNRISNLETELNKVKLSTIKTHTHVGSDELKTMLNNTINELTPTPESSFCSDAEMNNLRKKLNDLDPAKILSMIDTKLGIPAGMTRPSKDGKHGQNNPFEDKIELTIEEYAKFLYIICRLLELEEKLRLKTVEQRNVIKMSKIQSQKSLKIDNIGSEKQSKSEKANSSQYCSN